MAGLAGSAWETPPQEAGPVGYGVIHTGVRTDAIIATS